MPDEKEQTTATTARRGPGRPTIRGPRANVTMSWDLDLIAAVNAYTDEAHVSRNEFVDTALREALARAKAKEQPLLAQ